MRLIVLLTLCLLATPVWGWDDALDYSNAYKQGYKDGYSYGRPFTLTPLPPLAPLPRLGDDTSDHYLRGALDGLEDRENNTYSTWRLR